MKIRPISAKGFTADRKDTFYQCGKCDSVFDNNKDAEKCCTEDDN